MDLHHFDGKNLSVWMFQLQQNFLYYNTPNDLHKYMKASYYMEGEALTWLETMERNGVFTMDADWEKFVRLIHLRFGQESVPEKEKYLENVKEGEEEKRDEEATDSVEAPYLLFDEISQPKCSESLVEKQLTDLVPKEVENQEEFTTEEEEKTEKISPETDSDEGTTHTAIPESETDPVATTYHEKGEEEKKGGEAINAVGDAYHLLDEIPQPKESESFLGKPFPILVDGDINEQHVFDERPRELELVVRKHRWKWKQGEEEKDARCRFELDKDVFMDGLTSYEKKISYSKVGENKQNLGQLVTCERCAEKLHYKRQDEIGEDFVLLKHKWRWREVVSHAAGGLELQRLHLETAESVSFPVASKDGHQDSGNGHYWIQHEVEFRIKFELDVEDRKLEETSEPLRYVVVGEEVSNGRFSSAMRASLSTMVVFDLWHRWRWKDRRRDLQGAIVQLVSSKMSVGVNDIDGSFQHSQGKTWHNLDSPFPWSARCALSWSASCVLYIENGSGELNSESTCTAIVLAFGKSRFFLKETISRALPTLVSEMLSKYETVEDNYQRTRDFERNFWLTAFYVIFFRRTLVHPSSIIPWSVHKDGARDKGSLEKEAGMGNGAWNAIEEESYIWLQSPGQVECCIPKSVGMINSVYFLGCDYGVFDPGGERVLPEQGRRNREATFQSNMRFQENIGVKVVQLSLEEEVAARVFWWQI
jgi:hypothetical protein